MDLRRTVDGKERILIRRLNADLEFDLAWTHLSQDLDLFFIHQLGGDLEMEIRLSVIVLEDIVPDGFRSFFVAVKGPVDELDLRDLFV